MGQPLNLLDIAISAVLVAGRRIFEIYNYSATRLAIELKTDNSPLTLADKTGHQIISNKLKNTGLPVLSEEGNSIPYEIRKNWETFWLVDPLDGTKEFIKRNGEFTVNVALIHCGKPIAGVIYVPVTKILYVGVLNDILIFTYNRKFTKIDVFGAWKVPLINQEQITWLEIVKHNHKLPHSKVPERFTITGSRSHNSMETKKYIDEKINEQVDILFLSAGSSLKFCLVAEGKAHEYPRFAPTMEWDTAAGHAIVNAAGKKVWLTDFSAELTYNKENLLNPFFIVR